MRVGASFLATFAFATAFAASLPALAVGTRTFELDTLEKLSGGDVRGVSLGADGVVRAGWTLGRAPLPADAGTTALCALTLADGTVLLGTGPSNGGKVVRVSSDEIAVFADTKESAVNALAVDKAGVVYAATTSNRIYRLSQGKAEVYATLAGFVVSLAVGDDGVVYAGTSGKGYLYRIAAPGRATVLYDFPGEDVHAIAVGPNAVYAIANEEPATAQSDEHDSSSRRGGGRNPPGPLQPAHPKPGKGSLWRFDAQGRPERLMHHDEFHYVSLALDSRGMPYVGTGAEGRVYTVDDAHSVSLVAETKERQIGGIGLSGRSWFIVGSDPAVFHRIVSVGGPDAVWTSKPLDAGLRARFGHLRWRATGSVEVSTRSGDTQTPDSAWSAWSAPVTPEGTTTSPSGRFVQLRARLRDAAATIADPTLAFVTENLRAVVTDVGVRDRPGSRDSKEALPSSGSEPPKHDPVLHAAWNVDNPDNDELRYRLQFRAEGQARWVDAIAASSILTKPEFDWDTSSLPEGRYRLRVDASDELSNPPSQTTHHSLESAPVLVDNTPPVFRVIAIRGRTLHAEIVDGLGPITRVDVSVDGRIEWRPIVPVDGIFDTAEETIDTDVTPFLGVEDGPRIVAVRAFDAAGNFVVREVEAH
ncbi:MAG: hypothetical protein ABSC94_21185 [Polyangiaceae bacterium]